MNRRTAMVATVALGAAAIGLYELKYDVAQLEADAARLVRELAREQQAVHVLSADWAHLNQPQRLARLVHEYLDLVPLDADRIVAADELPTRQMSAPELAEADAATSSPNGAKQ